MTAKHKTQSPDLSLPEIRFCQLYAAGGISATQAFKDAGFAVQPASSGAANQRAARLLRKQKIREYIQDLRDAACEAAKVSVESLARGFAGAVNADVTSIFGPNGEALPPSEWPASLKRHIVSVEVEDIFDWQPLDGGGRERVRVGQKWKVKTENKTENRKILAQWKKMLVTEKADEPREDEGGGTSEQLVALATLLAGHIASSGSGGTDAGDGGPAGAVDAAAGAANAGVHQ